MTRGECRKVALKMGAIQHKSFLPKEIGVDDPRQKCQKVPFSAISSRRSLGRFFFGIMKEVISSAAVLRKFDGRSEGE
jgi:hypothetical protein